MVHNYSESSSKAHTHQHNHAQICSHCTNCKVCLNSIDTEEELLSMSTLKQTETEKLQEKIALLTSELRKKDIQTEECLKGN